jgi:hypothetical protein
VGGERHELIWRKKEPAFYIRKFPDFARLSDRHRLYSSRATGVGKKVLI